MVQLFSHIWQQVLRVCMCVCLSILCILGIFVSFNCSRNISINNTFIALPRTRSMWAICSDWLRHKLQSKWIDMRVNKAGAGSEGDAAAVQQADAANRVGRRRRPGAQTGSLQVWHEPPRNGGISILRFYDFSIFVERRPHQNQQPARANQNSLLHGRECECSRPLN